MRAENKNKEINTTQQIAIDFVQRTVSTINSQLAVEITRNGFDMELIRLKKQNLRRIVKVSESDPRYLVETFTVSGDKAPERIIMAVKWTPKGFQIEVNSDEVANAVKANKQFGIKKSETPRTIITEDMTEREVEVEALASQYEAADEAKLKKDFLKKC